MMWEIIILPDVKSPARPHRKRRIQKKWVKRYGWVYKPCLPDGKFYIWHNLIYCSRQTEAIIMQTCRAKGLPRLRAVEYLTGQSLLGGRIPE